MSSSWIVKEGHTWRGATVAVPYQLGFKMTHVWSLQLKERTIANRGGQRNTHLVHTEREKEREREREREREAGETERQEQTESSEAWEMRARGKREQRTGHDDNKQKNRQ